MNISKASLLGIIGATIAIIGVFLPWATSSSPGGNLIGGATYWSENGWSNYSNTEHEYFLVKIAIVLGLVGAIAILIKKLLSAAAGLAIGVSVLAIFVYAYSNLDHEAYMINIQHISDWSAGVGYGIWVSIIGSLILIAGGVLALMDLKKPVPSQSAQPEAQPK